MYNVFNTGIKYDSNSIKLDECCPIPRLVVFSNKTTPFNLEGGVKYDTRGQHKKHWDIIGIQPSRSTSIDNSI